MISKNAAQIIGGRIDVLNRSLRDAAVARVGKACDIHGGNTIVNRIDATCQILDTQFLNRVAAGVDWKHIVNGPVVSQFEFVDLPGCQRESALHRHVLSSLRIVSVLESSRCDPASLVPNVALEQRVARRQNLVKPARHRIRRIEKIRNAAIVARTRIIGRWEVFRVSLRKPRYTVVRNSISRECLTGQEVNDRR